LSSVVIGHDEGVEFWLAPARQIEVTWSLRFLKEHILHGASIERVPGVMLAVLVGWAGAASAATVSNQPTLPVISRGPAVTIYEDGFLKAPVKVYLRAGKEAKGDLGHLFPDQRVRAH